MIEELDIRISKYRRYKYDILIKDGKKKRWISFGNRTTPHYRDTTPLKAYSFLDHNYLSMRKNYISKCSTLLNKNNRCRMNNLLDPLYYELKYLYDSQNEKLNMLCKN